MPMMMAVLASKASISRKSVFSKPFTVSHFHVLPPLLDLPTVPLLPLTQMILSFTTLNPRMLVFVPELRISTVAVWAEREPTVNNSRIGRKWGLKNILIV